MVAILEKQLEIRAAGAVVWRAAAPGRIEVAVVHRPRYDDWSLPKGKLDPGETVPAAAVREVHEETGASCVLDRFLTDVSYPAQHAGRSAHKVVSFFSARATGGVFVASTEVDEVRWCAPEVARELLSYPSEASVLDAFTAVAPMWTNLLLVRHAKAGKREDWDGDDDLRPLSAAGLRQAAALATLLPLFGPDRVHSASRLRCVQTVRQVAEELSTEIVHEPLLSEEGYKQDPDGALERLTKLATPGTTPVLCSQGGVIPDLMRALTGDAGITPDNIASKKGSAWLLTFMPDPAHEPPAPHQLREAYYLPNPLPSPARKRP